MKYILLPLLLACALSKAQTFTLKSGDLGGQATSRQFLNGFGCTGDNVSPGLGWENSPMGTKSFAITIYDEDAPTGSGWWHWIIFDINKDVHELKADAGNQQKLLAPPGAIQSKTDFGTSGYGGPCPPQGDGFHKLTITVYALSIDMLGLDKNANPALVGFYLEQNVIEKASMIFYSKR